MVVVPKKTVVEWSGDGQNEFTRQETRARQRKDMEEKTRQEGKVVVVCVCVTLGSPLMQGHR